MDGAPRLDSARAQLIGLRAALEPLEAASEQLGRLGRFAERLPGLGHQRSGGLLNKPKPAQT